MNGYKHYKTSTPFIENKHKINEYKGDFIIKSGSIKTSGLKQYINKRHNMVNENVKVFSGTETAAEGLSLFGYREVHILEPHFNFSLIEQVIGRAIRNESHISLPFMKRNVGIYLYAATDKNNETVDLFKYRISENKAKLTGLIEGIMKDMAFDCYLNYNYNNINLKNLNVKILNSHNKVIDFNINDNPYSRICNYSKKCSYKCYSNDKKTSVTRKQNKFQKNLEVINDYHFRISYYKNRLVYYTLKYYLISLEDIKKELELDDDNIEVLNIALSKILNEKKIFTIKKIRGRIYYFNGY